MKFGTSNDEDVKITGLQQAPKDICIAKSIETCNECGGIVPSLVL
ncbi:hypothetical protein [Bacillus cereus]|nr:hypothetical protein [Bacillus cereus]